MTALYWNDPGNQTMGRQVEQTFFRRQNILFEQMYEFIYHKVMYHRNALLSDEKYKWIIEESKVFGAQKTKQMIHVVD